MEIRDYLMDELKRLNRMNDLLEKEVNQKQTLEDKHGVIKDNVLAMCEITKTLR